MPSLITVALAGALMLGLVAEGGPSEAMKQTIAGLENELAQKWGEAERPRIEQGIRQAAGFWRAEDGDEKAFAEVVRTYYAGDSVARNAFFSRMEKSLESLDGHMTEIARDFRWQTDLDLGEVYPFDQVLAGYDPSAHFVDDSFQNKLAFAVLLNFPVTTLKERLEQGPAWSRRQWAEARLAERFSKRVPAQVNLAITEAGSAADHYIADYNIWMHHVVDAKGMRLFPPKMRLLSHWNLRDQIRGDYSDGKNGLAKQRQIAQVMDRIVTQTIPQVVIDNPYVDWDPAANTVKASLERDSDKPAPSDMKVTTAPEPDTRYAMLLKTYQAARMEDPYSPTAPTLIDRRFEQNRQIPEERVKAMLVEVLSSPLAPRVARSAT